ncbi:MULTISPECIES: 2-dehydro-3-deoxygalactonokinase [Halocynthiibacter]|uniref:2-dehydro-3-deoxygalactonokinase n=1 Tax=Halocynthiibacter halioticoli TaxID=2986804 RepID=A0AAE3J242_9RHOB|nr:MULTISPECIES: 2-dehydro-3-deoxygalactonokinase [Halocynthiibacter]MCV6825380.1 2-dehydro-3-deoxygalactonokinase [Halocynthiibacter halioticoli]MCW4058381.1 2-dehydro-3-deoxygalactonokinase [Halocynthiibacter sp. SDUM655004]MDE0588599.1 2-dehydro-3-deoxygalactonokinase [Halocynthiibacter sp. C4]
MTSEQPDWIAVDWGTSHVRAWAMTNAGKIIAENGSAKGMGSLAKDEFEPALLELVEPWLSAQTTVVACGMVGARQGWKEAPYAEVPCLPFDGKTTKVETHDSRLDVHLLSGLSQMKPADVMRGEETQIAGFIAAEPDFDGVVCLPGTHTKWARISAKEVVSFQTFMSGELFACLSNHSVLRHSVAGKAWNDETFETAINDAISHPEKLAGRLFSLRADSLLHDLGNAEARARLSGLLIGAEIAAARPYWLGMDIAIIGADTLSGLYSRALELQGCAPRCPDAENLTLAGLAAAYLTLKETSS